ncbi:polymorphic toxin-type HINT domain-containing protein [Tepidibacter formicigenes]|jgi:hypothetical protein|uniref:Intein C-terminal splicing region/intein N-terminal splicing region n=1 Tax=Tepidibacter formicigenes DSM 15518 TaxID=1123349 RepID=A0A1M6PT59_9FIRM|nr:polymorphic toxin-type HINT domain-containing protein [Tepidibacter formicigenes]SHK11091.1 intein C-terminal splicing region/intein N-terminal splicing region [Tepidibacter formicigenes DSM 15518]
MFNKLKQFIATLLTLVMFFVPTASVFAQSINKISVAEKVYNLETDEINIDEDIYLNDEENSKEDTIYELNIEDLKEQLKEELPYAEVIEQEDSEFGQIYYIDKNYHKKRKKRSLWDFADIAMAGMSWYDVIKDPSLKNIGWAILDTAAIAPLLPSTAYIRKGGKYTLKLSELKKFAKTKKGKKALKKALRIKEGVCFVKGTKILTNNGYKNIEDIQINDLVYSKDIATGKEGLKTVKNIFVNTTDTLVHVFTENTEIETTKEHPFFVKNIGWKNAKDLKGEDVIVSYNDKEIVVKDVQIENLSDPVLVYNFEVDEYHTYFVSDDNLLVHNSCSLPASRSMSSKVIKQLNKMGNGLTKKFQKALDKGLAPRRYGTDGIIELSSDEILYKKGFTYTYKLKVAKAGNHLRIYGRLDDRGKLIFDLIQN